MVKSIFDLMSDDEKKIDLFAEAINDMINTQYILVDSKITSLLKIIATSSILYSFFKDILTDFDYKTVAKSCLVNDETEIKMPSEPKKIVALTFCILLDIDKKNIDLKDFLQFFKKGGDINIAYENFLQDVITPFKNSVIYLLTKINEEKEEIENIEKIEKLKDEELLGFQKTIKMFMARISSDPSLSEIIKEYLNNLFEDLISSVKGKDSVKAKNIFSILGKRLKTHKPLLIKEFEKIDITQLMIL